MNANDESRDPAISPSQAMELGRRLSNLSADREKAVPWSELKAELERRCPE